MANARDPGFCNLDEAELNKIHLGPPSIPRFTSTTGNEFWFPPDVARTDENIVTPYIYGECAFQEMALAFSTAISGDDRIYILAWGLDLSTPMVAPRSQSQQPKTFQDLISEANRTGTPVRAMLWQDASKQFGENNGPSVQGINALKYGGAIYDHWLIPANIPKEGPGVHHQKVVIVHGFAGVFAFIGGMDIQPNRILQPLSNPGTYIQPMHDVHLKVRGEATRSINRIFVERWGDHPDHSIYDNKGGKLTIPSGTPRFGLPSKPSIRESHQHCAVGRTYPNGAKHGMAQSYGFAPNGEHTAWDMVDRAVQLAHSYIYIEDQYLVSGRASRALADKLARDSNFKRIIILTNKIDWQSSPVGVVAKDLPYSQYLRARFLKDLQGADPKGLRWSIFVLKGSAQQEALQTRGIFVHSKLWIFDDRYAIVGSANCAERGYTHDSECVLGVAENDLFPETRLGFAHRLRMMLWSKHSLVPLSQLVAWQAALRVWDLPGSDSMIERYSAAADLGSAISVPAPPHVDSFLANVTDPRGD